MAEFRQYIKNNNLIAWYYTESSNYYWEVTFHKTNNQVIAYLSWIEGKNKGIEFFVDIVLKLLKISKDQNRSIFLFIEPTTQEGTLFIKRLKEKYKLPFYFCDSQINFDTKGYEIEIDAVNLNKDIFNLLQSQLNQQNIHFY